MIQIPLWAYWLAGIVFLIFVYIKLPEDIRGSIKTFMARYGVWIILIIAYFFFKDRWGFWTQEEFFGRRANTIFLLTALIMILGNLFLQKERYISTHAVADNRHGSCALYQRIGDYMVLNIGSCDADAFPWSWGHETWVVRKESFKKTGKQIFTGTQLIKCDLLEVPPQVFDFVSTTSGYHKSEIYYGEFSQELKLSDPKVGEMENKQKDFNRVLNEARTMLKGKTSAIKGYVSDSSAILKKARGDSLLGGLTGGNEQEQTPSG